MLHTLRFNRKHLIHKSNDAIGEYKDKDAIYIICNLLCLASSLMLHTLRFNRKHLISTSPIMQSVSTRIISASNGLDFMKGIVKEALDFNKSNDAIGEYKDKDAVCTIRDLLCLTSSPMLHTLRFNRKHLISTSPTTQSASTRTRMPSTSFAICCA